MQFSPSAILPIVLLCCSNLFMTTAWYGQLKFPAAPMWADRSMRGAVEEAHAPRPSLIPSRVATQLPMTAATCRCAVEASHGRARSN